MKGPRIFLLVCTGLVAGFALARNAKTNAFASASRPPQSLPAARVGDLKAPDGTVLKASYFSAGRPGPGVLLFHQSNRTRTSWDDVARQLAAAGINTLEVDNRAHGESGGKLDFWADRNKEQAERNQRTDLETAFQFLISQPGVQRDLIGLGGAGLLGVDNSVQTARLHPGDVKSFVLVSGETFRPGIEFLSQSQLPELFVVADNDEYPPTVEAMLLLYARSASPSRKLIHYVAAQEAPWLGYEPVHIGEVPASGGHGTDLFKDHASLPGIIVQWFVTTLLKTPGHAPADPLAASAILNLLSVPGGPAQVTQQLMEARQRDPKAQLFPEISASIVGFDYQREGDLKSAIEVLRVVQIAYPDSADAMDNLADVYLADGQKALARQYAQQALALLDAHKVPLCSWSDTEQRRADTRRDIEDVLKKTVQ